MFKLKRTTVTCWSGHFYCWRVPCVAMCVLCVLTIYPDTALQEVKQPSKKRSPDQPDKKLILGKYRTLEEVPREVQI